MDVRWTPEEATYKGCTKPAPKRLKWGWWSFSNTSSSGEASITAHSMETTLELSGVSCVYGSGESTSAGTFEPGETPLMKFSMTFAKTSGGFLCPTSVEMVNQFFTTEPKPLWMPDSAK